MTTSDKLTLQAAAALPAGAYARFFDESEPAFETGRVQVIDVDCIPAEDRPKILGAVLEYTVIEAEKRRRKVRFLPAQVIRRAMANLRFTPVEDEAPPVLDAAGAAHYNALRERFSKRPN